MIPRVKRLLPPPCRWLLTARRRRLSAPVEIRDCSSVAVLPGGILRPQALAGARPSPGDMWSLLSPCWCTNRHVGSIGPFARNGPPAARWPPDRSGLVEAVGATASNSCGRLPIPCEPARSCRSSEGGRSWPRHGASLPLQLGLKGRHPAPPPSRACLVHNAPRAPAYCARAPSFSLNRPCSRFHARTGGGEERGGEGARLWDHFDANVARRLPLRVHEGSARPWGIYAARPAAYFNRRGAASPA